MKYQCYISDFELLRDMLVRAGISYDYSPGDWLWDFLYTYDKGKRVTMFSFKDGRLEEISPAV